MNSASYLQGWLKYLSSDPKALLVAGAQAQKAADFVHGLGWRRRGRGRRGAQRKLRPEHHAGQRPLSAAGRAGAVACRSALPRRGNGSWNDLIALNRAAYQSVLNDVSTNLQTVVDAIASCEADIADREARLRVLHLQRDQLTETRERYETFLATYPGPAAQEKGKCRQGGNLAAGEADGMCRACKRTDDDLPPF